MKQSTISSLKGASSDDNSQSISHTTGISYYPLVPKASAPADVPSRENRSCQYVSSVLRRLHDDQNMVYLAARLQNYSEVTDARLDSVKCAARQGDSRLVADIALALTDATSKLGATKMTKLSITLHMAGRLGLQSKVESLIRELELEYETFKQNLIYAVG